MQGGRIIARSIIVQARSIILSPGVLDRIGGGSSAYRLAERLIRIGRCHGSSWVAESQDSSTLIGHIELVTTRRSSNVWFINSQCPKITLADCAPTDTLDYVIAIIEILSGQPVHRLADPAVERVVGKTRRDHRASYRH